MDVCVGLTGAFIEDELGGCKIHKDDIAWGFVDPNIVCVANPNLSCQRIGKWTTEINVFVTCAHVVEFSKAFCERNGSLTQDSKGRGGFHLSENEMLKSLKARLKQRHNVAKSLPCRVFYQCHWPKKSMIRRRVEQKVLLQCVKLFTGSHLLSRGGRVVIPLKSVALVVHLNFVEVVKVLNLAKPYFLYYD